MKKLSDYKELFQDMEYELNLPDKDFYKEDILNKIKFLLQEIETPDEPPNDYYYDYLLIEEE